MTKHSGIAAAIMAVTSLTLAHATGCGDSAASCDAGAEGCECSGGQCLAGLQCLSNVCVDPNSPAPSPGTGGMLGTGGIQGTGGTAGMGAASGTGGTSPVCNLVPTDGTEVDDANCLMWSVDDWKTATPLTATEQVEHCANLVFAGYDDWASPDIAQLRTLVRGCPPVEPGGSCRVSPTCTREEFETQFSETDQDCYNEDGCRFCLDNETQPTNVCFWDEAVWGTGCFDTETTRMWSSTIVDPRGYTPSETQYYIIRFGAGLLTLTRASSIDLAPVCVRSSFQ
ncbi:MAG: hypothetical protein AAF500_08320 [Myxococcota bacterium]